MSDTDTQSSSELEELVFDTDGRRVAFTLDEELYPRDAILGAAYLFIDRCFVFLARPADRMVQVRLKGKAADVDLESLAGEFANALLDQVVRFRVAQSLTDVAPRAVLEEVQGRAYFALRLGQRRVVHDVRGVLRDFQPWLLPRPQS